MLENPNFPVTPWTMVRGVVAAVRSTEHNNLSVLRPPSPQERERGSSRRGGSQIDIFSHLFVLRRGGESENPSLSGRRRVRDGRRPAGADMHNRSSSSAAAASSLPLSPADGFLRGSNRDDQPPSPVLILATLLGFPSSTSLTA